MNVLQAIIAYREHRIRWALEIAGAALGALFLIWLFGGCADPGPASEKAIVAYFTDHPHEHSK